MDIKKYLSYNMNQIIVDNCKVKIRSERFHPSRRPDFIINCEVKNLQNIKSITVYLGNCPLKTYTKDSKLPDFPVHSLYCNQVWFETIRENPHKEYSFIWKFDEVYCQLLGPCSEVPYIINIVERKYTKRINENNNGRDKEVINVNKFLITKGDNIQLYDELPPVDKLMVENLEYLNLHNRKIIRRSDLIVHLILKLSEYSTFEKNLIHIIKNYFDYDNFGKNPYNLVSIEDMCRLNIFP